MSKTIKDPGWVNPLFWAVSAISAALLFLTPWTLMGTLPVLVLIAYKTANKVVKEHYATVPGDVITRDMKDPYSQTVWAAFDSGKMVIHNVGDDHMTLTDLDDGTTETVPMEKDEHSSDGSQS